MRMSTYSTWRIAGITLLRFSALLGLATAVFGVTRNERPALRVASLLAGIAIVVGGRVLRYLLERER